MKKLLIILLFFQSNLYPMDTPTADNLYNSLTHKVSTTWGQANNRIFYFKVQNEDSTYNEFYDGTKDAITKLLTNDLVERNDFVFFDPRCHRLPIEFYTSLGHTCNQPRDESYPHTSEDCNSLKLIIYNIPDSDEINENFLILLNKTINHQKKWGKNNIVLNINSNLQHDSKILQLENLLGDFITSGDIDTQPASSPHFTWNKPLVIVSSLALVMSLLYYILKHQQTFPPFSLTNIMNYPSMLRD